MKIIIEFDEIKDTLKVETFSAQGAEDPHPNLVVSVMVNAMFLYHDNNKPTAPSVNQPDAEK